MVRVDSCPEFTGKRLGKFDPVSFDNDIDVFILSVQEQVPHKSAHHIRTVVKAAGDFSQLEKRVHNRFGKAFAHEIDHHPRSLVAGIVVQCRKIMVCGPVLLDQCIEQVRAGDDAHHLSVFHHRQNSLLVADDLVLNFNNIRIRMHMGYLRTHVFANRNGVEVMKQGFFDDLPGNVTGEAIGLGSIPAYEQCIDVVAGQQGLGLLAGGIFAGHNCRRRHQMPCQTPGVDFSVKGLEKQLLCLGDGFALDSCGGGGWVPPPHRYGP